MKLTLSRSSFGWWVALPFWPYSYRFKSAKSARDWAKKEAFKLIRCKLKDKA